MRQHFNGILEAVIERAMHVLTFAEAKQHAEECRKSMIEELLCWISMKGWRRMRRTLARNLIDSRWVLKWKLQAQQGSGNKSRQIKARLTAKGFKDLQGSAIKTFSGTTSRWGQRLIVAVCVQFGWKLQSADVSQAFLRGITFQSLSELPGEIQRSVQLELPAGSAALLRTVPGYENFDPATEVLDLLKPGYGLKDAPRLWSMALNTALSEAGLKPLLTDPQIFVKHVAASPGQLTLVLIASTHVDDLKLAGVPSEVSQLVSAIEKQFDKLKLEGKSFEHCGIRHTQHPDGSIVMEQHHYVQQLKPIPVEVYRHFSDDAAADVQGKACYMSLLGGVAWVVQTRPDIAVYVGYLQRHLQNPCIKHLKQLNRVLAFLRKTKFQLHYRKVKPPLKLMVISDSAFQANDPDCLAVKSGLIALCTDNGTTTDPGGAVMPLDWLSKKQNHVCRSTYAAEIHAALDNTSTGTIINTALNEILWGTQSATTLLQWFEAGQSAIPLHLAIDARSVFDSIIADPIKTPADKIFLLHAKKLREMIDRGQVKRFWWIDTRDMAADALNKGKIDRAALQKFFEESVWAVVHTAICFPRT